MSDSLSNLKRLSAMTPEELRNLREFGGPICDEHGPAAPSPEDALRAAQTNGLLPDPLVNAKRPPLLDALASPGDMAFRCQAYGNGKLARCERCGTQWEVAPGLKVSKCKDSAVPGWIHAVAPHGPRHGGMATTEEPFVIESGRGVKWGDPEPDLVRALVEDKGPKPYHGPIPPRPEYAGPPRAGCAEGQNTNQVSRPNQDGGGLRFSLGKVKIDLVPPEWIWGLATVLTRGAIKYAVRNWERGMAWSEVLGPMLRHTFKFCCGERYDVETGCHHMAMVAWNALVLMTYDIREIGVNDLVGEMAWLELVAMDMGPELKAAFEKRKAEAATKSAGK